MTRFGDGCYRLILLTFPRAFRLRHADGMVEQFRAQRDARGRRPLALTALWIRAVMDALRHGAAQRLEERNRARRAASGSVRPRKSVLNSVGDWAGDLRQSVRTLRHQPAFTLTAIATLTLGIGANAAVFALAWHTSFRALPYPDPDRLIRVFESNPGQNQPLSDVSPASLQAWAQQAKTLEAVGDFSPPRLIFPLDDNGELARYQSLSPGALAALGVRPILGRIVLTDAERQPDEVLISYEYWQRRFGGDPGVINRLHHFADVADDPERIIGVMPQGFQFLSAADIWAINQSYASGRVGRNYRATRQDSMVARVRSGHTVAEARAEIERISADLAREFPDTHTGWTPLVRTLHETVVGRFSTIARLLVAAACAVFFIACTNIAGLLLMRAAGRSQEVALRLALGGTRWRVVRLWLLEGLVVSAVSLAAGIAVARWLVKLLAVLAPASLPRLDQVTISWPVIVVGAIAAVGFVVVYALAPLAAGVMRANRAPLKSGEGLRTVSGGGRWRAVLLGTQAALAVILLSGAVLLTAALQRLHAEPLGFEPRGVLSMQVTPHYSGTNRRPWAEAAEYGRMLEERLKAYPGVLQAAVTTGVPLDDNRIPAVFRVDGDFRAQPWGAIEHSASTGYLKTIGLTLVDGRWFTEDDAFTADQLNFGSKVGYADQAAVITESMARTLWPGQSAVGQRLLSLTGDPRPKRVVGVVKDFKFLGANEVPTFRMFIPWRQQPGGATIAILVKTAGDPSALAAGIGAIAKELRPSTGLHMARTLEDLYRASSADTSFAASLVGGFSLLALLLTGIGVFGVVGYSIATRRREMAVRMALGAGRASISRTAAASGFVPVLIGTGVGLAAAVSCVRFVRGLLFEVNPLAPMHYVIAGAVLLVVATLASAAPLRRLLAIDPAESLRAE
ncbi:MAG TPA: ADOP family duplicated permease [Vicinamibacterales bacterium]|nr:ADOP family duplicated permease [Vicinamibacterales bacterium]